MSRVFSPYDLDFGLPNPLTAVLAESIDFERSRPRRSSCSSPRPTCGPAGRGSSATPISRPMLLMASACLPSMFQAVEIDGEAYWDGGYSGNPTMTPLVHECVSDDTIIVAINPVERPGNPAIRARHPQPAE
jgi:NTE family protein